MRNISANKIIGDWNGKLAFSGTWDLIEGPMGLKEEMEGYWANAKSRISGGKLEVEQKALQTKSRRNDSVAET